MPVTLFARGTRQEEVGKDAQRASVKGEGESQVLTLFLVEINNPSCIY
jgi:hypothetical protein